MENYTFTVRFHAENQEDAMNQARNATGAFDDGFQEAWLSDDKDLAVWVDPDPNFTAKGVSDAQA